MSTKFVILNEDGASVPPANQEEPELNLDDVMIHPPSEDALVLARLTQDNQTLSRKVLQLEKQRRRLSYTVWGLAVVIFFLCMLSITRA